jgi:hypothetical protein
MAFLPMDDRDAPLLDIFAPAPEPPRGGWLPWGAVAGAVLFAGCAVMAAVWNMVPSHGPGARVFEAAAPVLPPAEAAQRPREHAPGVPAGELDDGEATRPSSREVASLMTELPASWRTGMPLALPEADPWIMPDLPFMASLAPLMEPMEPMPPEPELPAKSEAPPTPATAPSRARPAAGTAKARPAETTGNAARCRGAIAAAQIGEDLSRTDLALMRARCAE